MKELKDKCKYEENVEKKEEQKKELQKEAVDAKMRTFYDKIGFSNDLTDQLQDLADFLKEFTHSTAVYIGQLVSPKKPIHEDEDDQAHKGDTANKIIHFSKATKGH